MEIKSYLELNLHIIVIIPIFSYTIFNNRSTYLSQMITTFYSCFISIKEAHNSLFASFPKRVILQYFAITLFLIPSQSFCGITPSSGNVDFRIFNKQTNVFFKIIKAPENTWGYDIYISKKLVIHQINIPGQTGDQGFRTKKQAEAVARLVVAKVGKGEMPPSVTQAELAKLRAI